MVVGCGDHGRCNAPLWLELLPVLLFHDMLLVKGVKKSVEPLLSGRKVEIHCEISQGLPLFYNCILAEHCCA